MTFPDDAVQKHVAPWWVPCDQDNIGPGALIAAFVPHVDQVPHTLTPIGRENPEEHTTALVRIAALDIKGSRPKPQLPVAALTLNDRELWTVYCAKKRPCLVVGRTTVQVDEAARRDMPKKATSPTLLVAPYYGADKDGTRAGYNSELLRRIRHAEYPQFMLDSLPIGGPTQSVLRFDHIQPVGLHYKSFEHTGFRLSDDAMYIVADWLFWYLRGELPEGSFVEYFQEAVQNLD
jgi:hypothetical protein